VNRLVLALRAFVEILFRGNLSPEVVGALGLGGAPAPEPPPASAPQQAPVSDGALQILGILQRDARLVDFLMEDISSYSDDQVGAAVRNLHEQARQSLSRYIQLAPVVDGIEGSNTKVEAAEGSYVKFVGNLPAHGLPEGGILRHKGWRAQRVDLPPLDSRQNVSCIAPAEVEVE
jgi:hypothetical protein